MVWVAPTAGAAQQVASADHNPTLGCWSATGKLRSQLGCIPHLNVVPRLGDVLRAQQGGERRRRWKCQGMGPRPLEGSMTPCGACGAGRSVPVPVPDEGPAAAAAVGVPPAIATTTLRRREPLPWPPPVLVSRGGQPREWRQRGATTRPAPPSLSRPPCRGLPAKQRSRTATLRLANPRPPLMRTGVHRGAPTPLGDRPAGRALRKRRWRGRLLRRKREPRTKRGGFGITFGGRGETLRCIVLMLVYVMWLHPRFSRSCTQVPP